MTNAEIMEHLKSSDIKSCSQEMKDFLICECNAIDLVASLAETVVRAPVKGNKNWLPPSGNSIWIVVMRTAALQMLAERNAPPERARNFAPVLTDFVEELTKQVNQRLSKEDAVVSKTIYARMSQARTCGEFLCLGLPPMSTI